MEHNQTYNSELEGKIALVTGGTKGIGKAIADRLHQAGAKVVVTARNLPLDIDLKHYFIAADLTVPTEATKVVEEVRQKFGTVDILINNMGGSTSPSGGFTALNDEHWQNDIQINLLAPVRMDRAVLPDMIEKESGVIIHISSISSLSPMFKSLGAYAVAKAALNNYSKSLSKEVTPMGLRVLTVSPGMVRTKTADTFMNSLAESSGISFDQVEQNIIDSFGGIPMGRMANPEEIADLVGYLASPRASYLSGSNFVIDGGTIPTV